MSASNLPPAGRTRWETAETFLIHSYKLVDQKSTVKKVGMIALSTLAWVGTLFIFPIVVGVHHWIRTSVEPLPQSQRLLAHPRDQINDDIVDLEMLLTIFKSPNSEDSQTSFSGVLLDTKHSQVSRRGIIRTFRALERDVAAYKAQQADPVSSQEFDERVQALARQIQTDLGILNLTQRQPEESGLSAVSLCLGNTRLEL